MSYNDFIKYFPGYSFLKKYFDDGLIPFVKWQRGEFICHSDSELKDLIFFTSGRGKVYKTLNNGKEVMYGTYGKGQIAGDVEFILEENTTCSLESSDDLSGYKISTCNLDEVIKWFDSYKKVSSDIAGIRSPL